jgi:hypothetical protein
LKVAFVLGQEIPDLEPLYMDYIGLFGYQGNSEYEVLDVVIMDLAGVVIASSGGSEAPAALTPDASGMVWDAVSSGEFELIGSAADAFNVGHIQQANGNKATVYDYVPGTGLKLSGRKADYNSVDFNTENLPDGKYRLEAELTADSEVEFAIDEGEGAYNYLISETGTSVTLSYELNVKNGASGGVKKYRVRTRGLEDYTIVNLRLYDADFTPASAPEETPAASDGDEASDAGEPSETAAGGSNSGGASASEDEESSFPVVTVVSAVVILLAVIIILVAVFKRKR